MINLLTELGNNLEVVLRIGPATPHFRLMGSEEEQKHTAQQRLDNYIRDEIIACKGTIR